MNYSKEIIRYDNNKIIRTSSTYPKDKQHLSQYRYRWRAHKLSLHPLHTYLLFLPVPGHLLHRFSLFMLLLNKRHTSLLGPCWTCTSGVGKSKVLRMIPKRSRERRVIKSRCGAQGRMSSIASSVRNVRRRSGCPVLAL